MGMYSITNHPLVNAWEELRLQVNETQRDMTKWRCKGYMDKGGTFVKLLPRSSQ
jgi:hypothetical protein